MMKDNHSGKRYSQTLVQNINIENAQIKPIDSRMVKKKEILLYPNEVVVNHPLKYQDDYIYSHQHINPKEYNNISREEREGTDKSNTAKRLIQDPTLQKIRMFMEMESKNRKRNSENERNNTQSFLNIIPNLHLDLSSREYPTYNTESNNNIREEFGKGGIIPLKGMKQQEDISLQQKSMIESKKEIKEIGQKEIIMKKEPRSNINKDVRQKIYYGKNNEEDVDGNEYNHQAHYININDPNSNYINDNNENAEEEADDNESNYEYQQDHLSEKNQNENEEEDDDNQYEVQVNPNAYQKQKEIENKEREDSLSDNDNNYNHNELMQPEGNEEEIFAEIKKFMNENNVQQKEKEERYQEQEQDDETNAKIEENDAEINQQKPKITKETLKPIINNDDNQDSCQEDMVKIQRTEENQYKGNSNNNNNTKQILSVRSDIIKENDFKKNQKYTLSNLIQQSSIQYEHHPPLYKKPTDQNEEFLYKASLNYNYNSMFIYDTQQSQQIIPQSKPIAHNVSISSRNQLKHCNVNNATKSDEEIMTEQSINPSNLYSTIKTETNKTKYYHHKDYLPTEVLITESPNKKQNNCFVERTAEVLSNPNLRFNTIEKENKYEKLKSKYQFNHQVSSNEKDIDNTNSKNKNRYCLSPNPCYNSNMKTIEVPNYQPIENKVKVISSKIISPSSSSRTKIQNKVFVSIPKHKEIEESDKDKFNLHYNYSNDYFKNQIHQKKPKSYLKNETKAIKTNREEFIQNKQLPLQIFTNNYNSIDVFSNRNIMPSSLKHDQYDLINQNEVKQFFDYDNYNVNDSNLNTISFDHSKPTYQMKTRINNENYIKLIKEMPMLNQCNCKSSRDDFASLYLKAFPTFGFTTYSPSSQSQLRKQKSNNDDCKLCYNCQKELREQSIMNTLL